ncbi:hypothetical protein N7492_008965 [Penicillium capsulatum]|uniref:F-box domain-containing protein n=1 Tax=Penicillium capsulatum TaxID=69766 RepID=A0A9W9LHM1_9EURO|nr:hypothetical protein N7492_008965 [Penicillium capsulatum]KAJ6106366.1 hypothetical protein N7512_009883 [Penicillium capsulatum]
MEDALPRDARAFDRLPPNVIECILYAADANAFASLVLLNRRWRRISESPTLYAHQLACCPSFAWSRGAIPAPGEAESLAGLKRQFTEEVRRNAFDVFLRPSRTLVRLISSSMSSSTAFPQGEVFRFSFSANGQMVLCISSSRIVVLEVASDPVTVKHELKTRRRPLGATIQDDGTLLAVLSSTHKVNVYRLSGEDATHIQTIALNDAPRDLIFSPTGSVLALAFDDSIEVHAVGKDVLATERRAARCLRVDAISFSPDGSTVLGAPADFEENGIVTITAPFYTETGTDASPEEVQMRMWTTQILFPEVITGFTHACLISNHEEADDSWILGYDSQLAAFRAIQIQNPAAGSVYFVSPFLAEETREMIPTMLPSVDEAGELLAVGLQDSEIWIYGVPKRLDMVSPDLQSEACESTRIGGDHHYEGQAAPRDNLAQMHKIIQQPKILVRGRQVTDMEGVISMRWARSIDNITPRRRLVAVAPGGVRPQNFGDEDIPIDGGRMLLLDFMRTTANGTETELDIEVGETAPKMLVEPDSSLDTEVELERRRTRLHRGDTDSLLPHLGHRPSRRPVRGSSRSTSQSHIPHIRPNSLALPSSPNESNGVDIPEIPYDNTQPRSQDTLHRAATAAASTRGRYDPRYRNTPSRRQIPHESDADNWVPPPPPYTREPDAPLPEHLRQSLLPGASSARPRAEETPTEPVNRPQTARVVRPYSPERPRPQSAIFQRLGTITNNVRSGRSRRNSSAAVVADSLNQEQANAPRASAPPVPRIPQQVIPQQAIPQQAIPQQAIPQQAIPQQAIPQQAIPQQAIPQQAIPQQAIPQQAIPQQAIPQQVLVSRPRPESPTPMIPAERENSASIQPLPTLAINPADHFSQQSSSIPQPPLGATVLGENYFPYSVSSPNLLHIPQPHGNALDLSPDDDAHVPERQRSFRRRVSTEPSSLPPPANEEWRRRIEDWNEHTIRERTRKRRSKCIVM